jgi:hypothetical protein
MQGNTTLTGLSPGHHNIVVFANDTLGNMGKTDTFSFEVKNKDFTPALTLSWIIVVIAVIIGMIAGLLIFHKRKVV